MITSRLPTEAELDAIYARIGGATAGPWKFIAEDESLLGLWKEDEYGGAGHILSVPRCEACCKHDPTIERLPCMWPSKGDSEFIEHARADLPMLLRAYQIMLMGLMGARASLFVMERLLSASEVDEKTVAWVAGLAKSAREAADTFIIPDKPPSA